MSKPDFNLLRGRLDIFSRGTTISSFHQDLCHVYDHYHHPAACIHFHLHQWVQDAGSVAATFIAFRSASPRQGILLVAGMIFSGAILGGSAVAMTKSGRDELKPEDDPDDHSGGLEGDA